MPTRNRFYDWSLRRPEAFVFCIYCAIVAWSVAHHEAWLDEAQAWLVARDCSLVQILLHQVHYETTPALWHVLLWAEVRLGISYTGMHWIAAGCCMAAMYLLLRYAPFPRWLRLSLPFTVAFVYSGPVIARNYSLVSLLIVCICILRRGTSQRPVLYALLLGLLANASAVAVLISLGLALEYAWHCHTTNSTWKRAIAWKPIAVFVLLLSAAGYACLPATDSIHASAGLRTKQPLTKVLGVLTRSPRSYPRAILAPSVSLSKQPVQVATIVPAPGTNSIQQWIAHHALLPSAQGHGAMVLRNTVRIAAVNLFVIASANWLGLLFYAALLVWLWKRGSLSALLPLIPLALIGPLMPVLGHHIQLWWYALVMVLWFAWPPATEQPSRFVSLFFYGMLAIVVIMQIAYGVHAVLFDSAHPFDGGSAVAAFLRPHLKDGPVVAFQVVPLSSAPYFDTNIFANHPTAYEQWSMLSRPITEDISLVSRMQPRYAVLSVAALPDQTIEGQLVPLALAANIPNASLVELQQRGYKETRRFCGAQPMRLGFEVQSCMVVFEPASAIVRFQGLVK